MHSAEFLFLNFSTALADSDYIAASMNITFTSGSPVGNMVCFNVTIIDDNVIENDEAFTVTLSLLSTGEQIGQTTITIIHDEGNYDGHHLGIVCLSTTPLTKVLCHVNFNDCVFFQFSC